MSRKAGNPIPTISNCEDFLDRQYLVFLTNFDEGGVEKKRVVEKTYKMTPDKKYTSDLEEDSQISLRLISPEIYYQCFILFTQTTIFDCLDNIQFSLKCVASIPEKRNDQNTILIR
ncbi:hypothetical protein RF11_03835 [Thelohanellus kitauei]|uniref:Uncharacterized protein n=1 Tax=Thelohanellus kitauei TaxID=669202 RepID=A0A0C2MNV8_THEKT|nr:hypothetical protein RF11_03835 [Thelohanellus kitauei]